MNFTSLNSVFVDRIVRTFFISLFCVVIFDPLRIGFNSIIGVQWACCLISLWSREYFSWRFSWDKRARDRRFDSLKLVNISSVWEFNRDKDDVGFGRINVRVWIKFDWVGDVTEEENDVIIKFRIAKKKEIIKNYKRSSID